MTPILVFLFGIPPSTAIGTDIAHGAAFKTVGAVQHRRMGNVRARLAGWMLVGSAPASLVGVWLNVAADRALRRRRRVGDGAGARRGAAVRRVGLIAKSVVQRRADRRSGLEAHEPRPGRRRPHRHLRRLHRRAHLGRERRLLRADAPRHLPAARAQGRRNGHLPRGGPALRRGRRALGGGEHRLRDPRLAAPRLDPRRADRRPPDALDPGAAAAAAARRRARAGGHQAARRPVRRDDRRRRALGWRRRAARLARAPQLDPLRARPRRCVQPSAVE